MSTEAGTFMRRLPVTLTQREKIERGSALAQRLDDLDSIEAEFEGVKETFKGRIKTVKSEVGTLQRTVSDGREFRDVECIVRDDWEGQRVLTIRTDTEQEVEARSMTLEERQRLPFNR